MTAAMAIIKLNETHANWHTVNGMPPDLCQNGQLQIKLILITPQQLDASWTALQAFTINTQEQRCPASANPSATVHGDEGCQ